MFVIFTKNSKYQRNSLEFENRRPYKATHCEIASRNKWVRECTDTSEIYWTNDMCHSVSCSLHFRCFNAVGSPVTANFTLTHFMASVRLTVVFQGNWNGIHPCRAMEKNINPTYWNFFGLSSVCEFSEPLTDCLTWCLQEQFVWGQVDLWANEA